jgi:hypothetical protein
MTQSARKKKAQQAKAKAQPKAKAKTRALQQQVNGVSQAMMRAEMHPSLRALLLPGNAKAYWDPYQHEAPPPLRTTFGRFTTVKSETRITLSTSTTYTTVYVVAWSQTAVSGFGNFFNAGGVKNLGVATSPVLLAGPLVNSGAELIRPLRMAVTLSNTTATQSRGGEVRIAAVDQPLSMAFTVGSTPTAVVTIPEDAAGISYKALADLTSSSEATTTYPAEYFSQRRTFVCPPTSYVAYNQHYHFLDHGSLTADSTTQGISTLMATSLALGGPIPAGTALNTTVTDVNWLGGIPPLMRYVFAFPPTAAVNTYTIEVCRQDGVRFAMTALGSVFHKHSPLATSLHEDVMGTTAQVASREALVPLSAGSKGKVLGG